VTNVVQSLWIGSRFPVMQRLALQSFLDHGHEFHLYAYDDIVDVPAGTTICDASTIFPRARVFEHKQGFGKGSYSTFSNLFRYKLILEQGGWWVDTDLVCLRRFDFTSEYVFATEREGDSILTATCAFKCPKGAGLLEYCLQVGTAKNSDDLKWSEIGPYLFDEAVGRFGLKDHQVAPHVFNPVNTWEFEDILKPDFAESRIAQSHAVHLWNQVWRHEQKDPDQAAHPDSLYAHLKRQHRVGEPAL
jgi:hypothetical protein